MILSQYKIEYIPVCLQLSRMILLNSESSIISETLKLSSSTPVNRLEKLDLIFDDNSGGHFHLHCKGKKEMRLACKLPAWKEIKKDPRLVEMIKEEYEGLWREGEGEVEDGFDISISCEIEKISTKIDLFANLKQKIISLPLKRAFHEDNSAHPIMIPLSGKDFYAVVQNKDQIVVLFGMNFEDQTDTVLAKVFLQEFYDTRNNRLEDAPVVLYGKEPPKELKDIIPQTVNELNYLTIVLFPRHYSSPQSQQHLLQTVPFLADYIHYHLKCSKAYLHQRMRAKTGEFLKILNRSKPENF